MRQLASEQQASTVEKLAQFTPLQAFCLKCSPFRVPFALLWPAFKKDILPTSDQHGNGLALRSLLAG